VKQPSLGGEIADFILVISVRQALRPAAARYPLNSVGFDNKSKLDRLTNSLRTVMLDG
jgi:hypothetical protein